MTNQFWDRGYCVIEGLLDEDKLRLAAASLGHTRHNRAMRKRNSGCVFKAHDEYSPAIGEMLLRHCKPVFEKVIGQNLLESFAYWRVYDEGAELKRHVDRVGCEISATITVAHEPADINWPIMIEDMQANQLEVRLEPGSALLYQGHKVAHWRQPFVGTSQWQLLFHYVLEDGQFADRAFDGREADVVESYYVKD